MDTPEVTRPRPTAAQLRVLKDPTRFQCVVASRRFGKSYLASMKALEVCVNQPGANVLIATETLGQTKRVYWKVLEKMIPEEWLKPNAPNKSEMTFEFINGSTIYLSSAEQGERIRGMSLTYIVADEFAKWLYQEDILIRALMPSLSDQRGRMLVIGTPRGRGDLFHQMFEQGQSESDKDAHWTSWAFDWKHSYNLDEEEISIMRSSMDPIGFAQEYLASFEGSDNRVFYQYDPQKHNLKQPIWASLEMTRRSW